MVALGGGGSGKSRPFLTANPGFLSFTPAPRVGIVISKLSSANFNIYFFNTYFTFYNTTSEHLPFSQTQVEIFKEKSCKMWSLYFLYFNIYNSCTSAPSEMAVSKIFSVLLFWEIHTGFPSILGYFGQYDHLLVEKSILQYFSISRGVTVIDCESHSPAGATRGAWGGKTVVFAKYSLFLPHHFNN